MKRFEQIDIHQAKSMIDTADVTVVDIRQPQAYQQGHIHGAVLVTDQNVDNFLKQTDKQKPLICYCYHGHSSQSAAGFFNENGFKKVYSIRGGFEEWKMSYPATSN